MTVWVLSLEPTWLQCERRTRCGAGAHAREMPVRSRHTVFASTRFAQGQHALSHYPSITCILAADLPLHSPYEGRTQMQQLITFMAVVAGLVFSVAIALVVKEMIFGQVFRVFFRPQ